MNKKIIKIIFHSIVLFFIFFSTKIFPETIIVALGDSLTEGYGVEKEEAFPYLVQEILFQKGYDVKVINGGVSGSTTSSGYSRLKWYMRIDPDIVILALGGNDGLRGLSLLNMKKNLSKTIELAKSQNTGILLAGMQIPSNYGKNYTDSFREVFYELARKHKIPFIPFLLKDVGGVSSLNQKDGIHPNPQGHQIMAKTVIEYLEPLLQKEK